MATIVLSSFVIRQPVGGVLSNNLQLLTGLERLGHEVYLVEKSGYEDSCFDPELRRSSDDCSCGTQRVAALLERHGLAGRWCYVDAGGAYHGMDRGRVEEVVGSADLFIDRGLHGTWDDEAAGVPLHVLMDPDPGFRQIKMQAEIDRGRAVPSYDAYYTYGHNIGTDRSAAPTAGVHWRHLFHPVDTCLYPDVAPPGEGTPCTTVMNWRALEVLDHDGRSFGMKDRRFPKFIELPRLVDVPMEVAVEGRGVPVDELCREGWLVASAVEVGSGYDYYHRYLRASLAEFSVVKDVYAALSVGWFSDRSAAYLAHGRPVIVEDNGISDHLPTGEGLFEVSSVEEAVDAIGQVRADPSKHSKAARGIAEDHLDARRVLGRFLDELGIASMAGNRRTR
jgi:hypothetical protein